MDQLLCKSSNIGLCECYEIQKNCHALGISEIYPSKAALNHPCRYTGEDGFELSIPNTHIKEIAEALVSDAEVRPCGLGPRDSLRLEAGLCLYGNDLEQHITPVEAGLAWTVGKRRREKFDFLGGEVSPGL